MLISPDMATDEDNESDDLQIFQKHKDIEWLNSF